MVNNHWRLATLHYVQKAAIFISEIKHLATKFQSHAKTCIFRYIHVPQQPRDASVNINVHRCQDWRALIITVVVVTWSGGQQLGGDGWRLETTQQYMWRALGRGRRAGGGGGLCYF